MTKEQLFTQLVKKLSAKKLFFGHAVVDAEDEAMLLMMTLLGQTVEQILSTGDEHISAEVKAKSLAIVEARLTSLQPMAYLLGRVYFCGLSFHCDPRALVPRSPIAELIVNGFASWLAIKTTKTVLDLCTGGGCIGISLAHYFSHLSVTLADISPLALSLAEKNIALHDVQATVSCIQSDLFEHIQNTFDLIVSNPPYVSEAEYRDLPEEYKHEPKLGLVSSQQGLEIPVKILLQAADYLNDNGLLFLEVGYSDTTLQQAFSHIDIQWIDFLQGGQGVCVFSKEKLLEYRNYFNAFLAELHVI